MSGTEHLVAGSFQNGPARIGVVCRDTALLAHFRDNLEGSCEVVHLARSEDLDDDDIGILVIDDEPSDALMLEVRRPAPGRHRSVRFTYDRGAVESLVQDLFGRTSSARSCDPFARILGGSAAIEMARDQLRSVARFRDVSVLLLGETGTGKELAARALHDATFGPDAPFVAINCAAIPEHLLESELFGHEAGAYTGARGAKGGLLEAASGGTVFLDEVGEMPATLQPKLLRLLETREFRRVGSTRTRPLEARVLSATNRDPWDPRADRIRSDLTYRIAGFTVRLPALRERGDDIHELAENFLGAFEARHQVTGLRLDPAARELLTAHDWPGNVRELKATLEHAAILAPAGIIEPRHVRNALGVRRRETSAQPLVGSALPTLEEPHAGLRGMERQLIVAAMRQQDGNVSRAARQLGLPRSTLRSKLSRLTPPWNSTAP